MEAPKKTVDATESRLSHMFDLGFTSFMDTGEFSDVTILVRGKRYQAHKLILAYHSDFFKQMFLSSFKEGSNNEVELRFEDTYDVFPLIFRSFYTGELIFTEETAIPLLKIADQLQVRSIKAKAEQYLVYNITWRNAPTQLSLALQFNAEALVDDCLQLIASNFYKLWSNTDFSVYPLHVLLKMLKHPKLNVTTEVQVLVVVLSYIRFGASLSQEDIRSLMEQIRFAFLQNNILTGQSSSLHRRVKVKLVCETLLFDQVF